jgi:hypothetical protein
VLFALPTYGFVAVMFVMIATGIAKCRDGSCPQAAVPNPLVAGAGVVGVLVILQAFALGQRRAHRRGGDLERRRRFRRPKGPQRCADAHRDWGAIAISLFLGVSYLAVSSERGHRARASRWCRRSRAASSASSSSSFVYYSCRV